MGIEESLQHKLLEGISPALNIVRQPPYHFLLSDSNVAVLAAHLPLVELVECLDRLSYFIPILSKLGCIHLHNPIAEQDIRQQGPTFAILCQSGVCGYMPGQSPELLGPFSCVHAQNRNQTGTSTGVATTTHTWPNTKQMAKVSPQYHT